MQFKNCFSRKNTFGWFIIIVIGLMVRTDAQGISSIVRAFGLSASSYPLLLHFFKSEGYCLSSIERYWQRIISKLPILYRVSDRVVMVGDGVKQSKEGRFMPGVMKLHQESENSAKGEYIFGHLFGGVGVLLGNAGSKLYCVLVSLRLHDGLEAINTWWKDESYIEESHVVKIIKDAARASKVFGSSILLLDRLFLTVPMLTELANHPQISVVTKAKRNAVAYYHPSSKQGPGRKPVKGEKVNVVSLFESKAASFMELDSAKFLKQTPIKTARQKST